MCVIAGYVGTERAAPILIEMLRREEGLAGAFNTGIATIHEGRLYWDKVVGDLKTLERETEARDFPGTIGIIHSRIPGGERNWAHPFVDTTGNLAYIANGALGRYQDMPELARLHRELRARGYHFDSEQQEEVEKYCSLDGKTWVHFSEIMCQTISNHYAQLGESELRFREAMGQAFERHPSEIVGVALHAHHPDEITVARHNKPMMLGRDANGGQYLASTAIAFPKTVCWQSRMAPEAVASIQRSGEIRIRPLNRERLLPLGVWPSAERIEKAILEPLREHGERNMEQMFANAASLYPEGVVTEKESVVYDLLQALLTEGRIELQNRDRPGVRSGSCIPWTYVIWKG